MLMAINSGRHWLCCGIRAFVRYALDTLDHGFNGLDRALIYHGSLVGDKYDIWFEAWAKAVQVRAFHCRVWCLLAMPAVVLHALCMLHCGPLS